MKNDTIIITSSLLFVIAFVVVFFFYEAGLVISGLINGLDPIMYHNTISYTHISDPADYSAFGGGPVVILIMGLLALVILLFFRLNNGILRLFLTWISFISFSLILIQLPVIPFSKGGDMTRFLSVFNIVEEIKYLLAGLGIIFIILLGLFYVNIFLSLASSDEETNSVGKRRMFILKIALIPWLLGSLFSLPFRVPPFEIHYLVLPFIVGQATVWSLIGAFSESRTKKTGLNADPFLIFKLFAVLILQFAFYHLVLSEGLKF